LIFNLVMYSICESLCYHFQLICDGARLYVEKIQSILERNCYYDDEEKTFNITDSVCVFI